MTTPSFVGIPPLHLHADLTQALGAGDHDAVLVIGQAPLSSRSLPAALQGPVAALEQLDAAIRADRATVALGAAPGLPGGRIILSTTGDLGPLEQDVRVFAAAAAAAVARAISSGARSPLLVVQGPPEGRYARHLEVAVLGALGALWEPLELRWHHERPLRLASLGVVGQGLDLDRVAALERSRIVARDICGTEPEMMAPEGMARYCEQVFEGTPVRVEVLRDQAALRRDYPLIGAVARACEPVERHHPRVIRLTYEPAGPVNRTLFFAGKGLTYDTGGADLKVDGHMAGMSRDKGGAGAVAGLLRVCAERQPSGVRVVGLIGAVRNSIGSNAFVTDEIIVARSGLRVRIGNTDAEGRLVLADLLADLLGHADHAPSPALFTIATLTGHAAVAFGPYTGLVPNGIAEHTTSLAGQLQKAGEAVGDPIERSRIRPEDYLFVGPRSAAEDTLSCNSLPSSRTPRGHQFPAAFIDLVSGLRAQEKAGGGKPFIHVDIAGSALANGSWASGTPTGAPILAFAEALGLV
jgi:leucyl aminopeptidase